ncbi:hypothetical protein BDR26DRAFT_919771 [Obelidium mucronatum]|nr:hypothetical protein BDR26DRAFT_919771 [Obelidium mucronatum]
MQLTDEEAIALQTYLVGLLEPVCDADPTVLAEYVVALLKHEKSDADLEQNCLEQLEEFLKHETQPFVRKLFAALSSKSYLETHQQINSPTKRRREQVEETEESYIQESADDGDDERRARRRRRFGDEGLESQGGSQEQMFNVHQVNYNNNNFNGGSSFRGGFGAGPAGMRRKGRCYEFDRRGFCSKGESCPYDHSPINNNNNGFGPGMMMGGAGFGMNNRNGPIGGPVMMPGMPGMPGIMPIHPQFMRNGPNNAPPFMPVINPGGFEMGLSQPTNPDAFAQQQQMQQQLQQQQFQSGGFRGGFRGGMRGGMRGGFRGGFTPNGPPRHRNQANDTLVVENIPHSHCNLDAVNSYFKTFGTITDIKVDIPFQRATVKYSSPEEAKAAHTSPEVIFGNRFVKVYFQDPAQPQPQQVSSTPSHSQPHPQQHQSNSSSLEQQHQQPQQYPRTASSVDTLKELAKQKQQFILTQMETQKQLLTKLESKTLTPKQKQELMETLKSVQLLLKDALEEGKKAAENAANVAAAKQKSMEILLTSEVDQQEDATEGNPDEDAAELEKLKAEAQAMGLDPANAVRAHTPILRGGPQTFRGRGGRGGYRGNYVGSGAPVARSLDLRPKKLSVQGALESDKVLLMQQLQPLGRVILMDFNSSDSSLVLEMAFRHESEKVLNSGLKGGNAESLVISWYDDSTSASASGPLTTGDHTPEDNFAS